jgi:hypothetical protein
MRYSPDHCDRTDLAAVVHRQGTDLATVDAGLAGPSFLPPLLTGSVPILPPLMPVLAGPSFLPPLFTGSVTILPPLMPGVAVAGITVVVAARRRQGDDLAAAIDTGVAVTIVVAVALAGQADAEAAADLLTIVLAVAVTELDAVLLAENCAWPA